MTRMRSTVRAVRRGQCVTVAVTVCYSMWYSYKYEYGTSTPAEVKTEE